jgi:hypothetical protein
MYDDESYKDACRGLSRWVCPACGRAPCNCAREWGYFERNKVSKGEIEEQGHIEKPQKIYTTKRYIYLITALNIVEVAENTNGLIFQEIGGKPQIMYNDILASIGDTVLLTTDQLLKYEVEIIESNILVDCNTNIIKVR